MVVQQNAALPDGLEISGYRIVKKIAVGGFSIVYLAQDADGQDVAIKEYLPAALVHRKHGELLPVIAPEHRDLYRIGLKYFFDEGRALASIVHPNVIRVLNFFRANETVYLVMSYEHGRSLQEHLARRRHKGYKPLVSESAIRRIFAQVMDALREVHTHKLLHLDLKPANIYLRTDGTPLLLDFGAARQTLQTDLSTLHPMYTPGFAAPELYTKKELGPWTDIYSIGASMFNCMVGVPPQSATERTRDDRMDEFYGELETIYSPELLKLVRWSLMLDPLQRPQSVFALQKPMRHLVEQEITPNTLLSRIRKLVN
ncbi:MAG: serine/threonine protein kinase [Oxalobacteraceae bacterium]|jgi:serine/threonine protein kinase|nr:serine/threonine protein kinase [Oxalobacteraceae bacterium]